MWGPQKKAAVKLKRLYEDMRLIAVWIMIGIAIWNIGGTFIEVWAQSISRSSAAQYRPPQVTQETIQDSSQDVSIGRHEVQIKSLEERLGLIGERQRNALQDLAVIAAENKARDEKFISIDSKIQGIYRIAWTALVGILGLLVKEGALLWRMRTQASELALKTMQEHIEKLEHGE